jgi:hypothetical protein
MLYRLACGLIALFALSQHALAQTAVGCVCYCGIQLVGYCTEQTCKNACGYRPPPPPSPNWGCVAETGRGAWGRSWGFANRAAAVSRAVAECQNRSGSYACQITSCSTGRTASNPPPAPNRSASNGQRTRAYSCAVCDQKLRNDVSSGWASGRFRSYVSQAIAGYYNCKRRAYGVCQGDRLVSLLNGCSRSKNDNAYRACVSRSLR